MDRYYKLLEELSPLRGDLKACQDKVARMEASEIRRRNL